MSFDPKGQIKDIILKLTKDKPAILTEKIFELAADFGIGDRSVNESIQELLMEQFIIEPVQGVIKRTV